MCTFTIRPQTEKLLLLKKYCDTVLNKVPVVWRMKLPADYRIIILSDFNSCKAVQNTLVPEMNIEDVFALYVHRDKQIIYVRPFPKERTTEFLSQFHEGLCKVICFQPHNARILRKVGMHCSIEEMTKDFFKYVAYRNAQKSLPKELAYFNDIEKEIRL